MTSLVKLMLYSLLATASFALPTQNNEEEALTARSTCPSSMIADFDDGLKTILPPGIDLPGDAEVQIVPDDYKGLKWNKGFRYTSFAGSVSKPNIAISDITTALTGPPRISLDGDMQYFNLKSARFQCQVKTLGALPLQTSCIIKVTGTKTNGETVSQQFINKAEGFKEYTLLSPDFNKLRSVEFSQENTELPLLTATTVLLYDNIMFDIFKDC
ncbi:hypothetical protein GJ744_009379 [Endocarpon pusillum]|uniref:Secreted protein n=1 Tax=Endocarpon pusillum TaxID=364733 RepID=A0A8H7AG78_9EURO|nr:hypothetical protein GJ744_009379 [Endocarpon pusillum]